MNKAYSKLFWGVLLGTIRLELGPITLIPAFIAWIIVHLGITELIEHRKRSGVNIKSNFAISIKLVEVLVGITFLASLGQWMDGGAFLKTLPFLYYPILLMTIEIAAVYFLLQGIIEMVLEKAKDQVAERIMKKQKIYLIIAFFATITIYFGLTFSLNLFVTFGVVSGILGNIYLLALIQGEKKRLEAKGDNEANLLQEKHM